MKDLSLHLMDIAQNSTAAGARRIDVALIARLDPPELFLSVADDGRGMDAAFLARVADPFTTTRTTRKVGLGIPLLKLAAEMTGGKLSIVSEPGQGTTLVTVFGLGHIDRIPVGDIPATMAALVTAWTDIDWVLHLESWKEQFDLSTMDMKEILGDVPLGSPEIAGWLEESVRDAMKEVFGGILDEIAEGSGSHP